MSLKGNFVKKVSQRFLTSIYSFELSCSSLFGETFDCAIISCYGQPMLKYNGIKMGHNSLLTFNVDTLHGFAENFNGWCQGDYFAILDKKGKEKQKWILSIKEYTQGECPECHGAQRCSYCHGNGKIYSNASIGYESCRHCGGTGVCPTCYVPKRKGYVNNSIYNQLDVGGTHIDGVSYERTQVERVNQMRRRLQIEQEIMNLREEIQKLDIDLNIMKLKNQEISQRNVYLSYVNLKYKYQRQLLELQSQLNTL